MMTKKGRRLGAKSIEILKTLGKIGELAIDDFMEAGREYDRKLYMGMAKRLYNLENAGYVKKTRHVNKNQSFFHLTPKGKLQFLKYLHLEKIRKKKWDGHWRVIIFDIPEISKKWRDFLRVKLKELGFLPLQESVYITPYPVTIDLDNFLREWNLRKYLRYLTVTEIDDEGEFKSKFGLD